MRSTSSQASTRVLSASRHGSRAVLAMLLRRSKTCRVSRRSCGATSVYVRWRPWYSELLVPAGNAYMALIGEEVRFLPRREWLAWETRVYASLIGVHVDTDAGGRLLVPGFPGVVLADFLRSDSCSDAQKLAGFQAAVASLRLAHAAPVLWPDGIVRPFSHGDATARNVLYDPQATRATWIDFETLHTPSLPTESRHADDLRALMWSAAECLGPAHFDALCLAVITGYGNRAVLASLNQLLAGQARPNVYHLAQGFLPTDQHDLLTARLRELNADR
jgi:hypothetical protein